LKVRAAFYRQCLLELQLEGSGHTRRAPDQRFGQWRRLLAAREGTEQRRQADARKEGRALWDAGVGHGRTIREKMKEGAAKLQPELQKLLGRKQVTPAGSGKRKR
jgi:hypothetical protein